MLNIALIGIILLTLVGFSLLFHVLIKVTPEESWASAVMTILVFVYITGLFGNAGYSLVAVAILAVMGIIVSVAAVIRKSEYSFCTFFSPGIVMMFGITMVGAIAFKGMYICNWDELYQWGKAANYMVEFDRLPGGEGFSGESILLSSTTFFHYFMSKLSYVVIGTITESNYYVSNLLLWFSALILPFAGDGWKSFKRVWGFGLFHFLLTAMIFVQPYYNIYTDQATAYWTGGLIAWLCMGKCSRRNLYLIPLVLLNVGLMKSMVGPMFAVIAVMVMVILYCVSRIEKKESVIPRDWKRQLFSKKGLGSLCAALSPVTLIIIWSFVTGQNGLFRFHAAETVPGEENRAVLTLKSMIGWIFKSVNLKEDHLYLSYGIFILITIGMVCLVYPVILDKKESRRYNSIMYVYILGFAGYFFVMYFAYMKVFGYIDSIRAMSLNRYYSDYMMLGVVPLTVPLFKMSLSEKQRHVAGFKKGIIFVSVLCIVYGSSDYLLQNLVHAYALDTGNYAEREKMVKYTDKIKNITDRNGKIYFIDQKNFGWSTLVADYELEEQLTRGGMCFKFRKNTEEPILGLTEYPIETLPNVLMEQGYEYLWVYSTDSYFNENMEEMFGIRKVKNGDFYRVLNSPEGVTLEYMQRIK